MMCTRTIAQRLNTHTFTDCFNTTSSSCAALISSCSTTRSVDGAVVDVVVTVGVGVGVVFGVSSDCEPVGFGAPVVLRRAYCTNHTTHLLCEIQYDRTCITAHTHSINNRRCWIRCAFPAAPCSAQLQRFRYFLLHQLHFRRIQLCNGARQLLLCLFQCSACTVSIHTSSIITGSIGCWLNVAC